MTKQEVLKFLAARAAECRAALRPLPSHFSPAGAAVGGA